MSLVHQLSALEAVERRLDEELRGLALTHYRALSTASSLSVGPSSSLLPSAALFHARAACEALVNAPVDEFSLLQRRIAHLRAAAASSGAAAGASRGSAQSAAGVAALDLLELPALMDSCVRAALSPSSGGAGAGHLSMTLTASDDAVDLVDFACTLFASQRLLRVAVAREGDAAAPSRHAELLVGIVREVLVHAAEFSTGLSQVLGSRAPLPIVLKAVALLRRLSRIERRSLEKSILAASEGAAAPAFENAPAHAPAGNDAETASIGNALRLLFVAERDGFITREIEAALAAVDTNVIGDSGVKASTAGALPAVLRVLELHRALTTELVSQFSAVASSLVPRAAPGGSAAAPPTAPSPSTRVPLIAALAWRSDAVVTAVCETLLRLPEASLASVAQPISYAARRSARFGIDSSAALGTAWSAIVLDTIAGRLALARRALSTADAKDERACLALVNAALRATLGVFNSVRSVIPAAYRDAVTAEFLQHFEAVVDERAVTSWASCAGAASEALDPLLTLLEKFSAE